MRILSHFCAMILYFSIHATSLASEVKSPEQLVEEFFAQVSNGDVDQAFIKLFEGSSLEKTDPIGANQVPSSVAAFMKAAGPMLDYEKIGSCAIGARTLRLIYFQNLSLRPLTWVFYYYRNSEGWALTYLKWNGQYEGVSGCK